MQAFADGVNYYLHTHPEANPQVITRYEPWMPMFFFEGSIGGDIESISTEKLKAFYEQEEVIASNEADLLAEPQGSNGIAIAPELSESGNAMLLINPHTSFYFRPEIQITSEEGLSAYGAVTWGQFFIYQGFNENCGWMHTSSNVDVADVYTEKIITKNNKLFYEYDKKIIPVKEKVIEIKYLDNGKLIAKKFNTYRSKFNFRECRYLLRISLHSG